MKNLARRVGSFVLVFALLLLVTSPPAAAGADEADCDAALIKCLFAYTLAFGLPLALTLCMAGYYFCLQFLA